MPSSIIIRHVEFGLKLIGLWPEQNNSVGFYVVLGFLILHMPFQFWHAIVVFHNFEALMANLGVLMTIGAGIAKLFAFRIKGRYVKYVVKEMLDDWISENKISDIFVIKKHMKRGNYLTKWLIIAYNGVVIMYMVLAIKSYLSGIIAKRIFIVPSKYPVTWKQSPMYEILIITQFIGGMLSTNGQVMVEGLLTLLVLHVGTKAYMLQRELAKVSDVCLSNKNNKFLSEEMKTIIEKHCNFIDFVEKIKDIYSYVSFFHVFIFTLLHVIIAYMLLDAVEKGDSSMKIFVYGLFTTRSLVSTMIHCIAGEYLMNKSLLFFHELYNCPWYEFNLFDRKAVCFILMKARKPMYLTPAKFGCLSLNYLSGIIRTSYSFLSLVRVTH